MLDRYLSREAKIIVQVVSVMSVFYFLVLVPIQGMQSDIEYIKENHLKHIEEEITEIRQYQGKQTEKDESRDGKIERVLTILEERTAKIAPK